jgi:hypothetical protein
MHGGLRESLSSALTASSISQTSTHPLTHAPNTRNTQRAAPADAFPVDSIRLGLASVSGGGAIDISHPTEVVTAQQYCFAVRPFCGGPLSEGGGAA